ncbi:MAG: hypothetical protein WCV72_01710 [Patescibacteria group bacterium]
MEIRQKYFAEKSLFREKRVLFIVGGMEYILGEKGIEGFVKWRESKHKSKADIKKAKIESNLKKIEAIQAEKKAAKDSKAMQEINETQQEFRLQMADRGVILDKDLNPAQSAAPQNPAENAEGKTSSPIEGVTTKISILKNIPLKAREKQELLAEQINDLLAGKKSSGEKILRKIDPGYVRPASGNCSLETQRAVAKAVGNYLSKELVEKAMAGDKIAEKLAANKIEQIYDVLSLARTRIYRKEVRAETKNEFDKVNLGWLMSYKKDRPVRADLARPRFKQTSKFEKLENKAFKIEEDPEKLEADKIAAKKERSGKPKSKLGKAAYYGLVAPWLAHTAYKKIIEPTAKFLVEKTFGKGVVVGTARTALWVLGSGMMGGIPAIPVVVEAAIWTAQQIKPGKKAEKVKDDAVYAAKNVANIGTLGIPRYIGGVLKKGWDFVKLDRKPKPTKPANK